jgi:CubicO group peptidase (beta-lactamase class C family)
MRQLVILSFIALMISCAERKPVGLFRPEGSDLKPGETTPVRTLVSNTADTFRISLDSGALACGNVDQRTFDAVVEIYNTKMEKVGSFDSPSRGQEYFWFRSWKSGVFKIVVSPFEKQSGEYTITFSGADPVATTADGAANQFLKMFLGSDQLPGPGAAVAVMKDGKIVFSKGYGYADLESDRKITPTTIFHVASVSKQFTAFVIAMLADQGKLSLDDDIRKYLPELHDFGTPITINHLVHHTSGLRDQWNLLMMAGWRLDDVITEAQIMRLISKQRELNFKPGEEFVYCNTGFTLMAVIVKRVTGKTLNEWTKANVFEPLGMRNTSFYDDHERVVPNRAYSYYKDGRTGEFKKSVLSYANAGATSLFTTVEDLNIWAQNFETMKVGNAKVMAMMHQKFILNKGDTSDYAMGLSIGEYRGAEIVSHSGGDAGFRSFLVRFPEQHVSVAVASNYAQFPPGGLAFAEAAVFLGDALEPVKEEVIKPQEPSNDPPFDPKSVKLNDYVGSYYSEELETRYSFEVKNDTLVSHHQRHNDFKLNPRSADTFNMNFLGTVAFTRDGKGRVDGFKASSGRVRNLVFKRE